MSLTSWLFGDDAQLAHWTPQRAARAERDTLRAEGIVNEPVYLWSRPAQERERLAKQRRMLRSVAQPTGRAIRERRQNVTPWKVGHNR